MATENRLISAFTLVTVLAQKFLDGMIDYDELMSVIDDIPTEDAVEVVRCKDCISCEKWTVDFVDFLICHVSGR